MGVALSHSTKLIPIPRVAQIEDQAFVVLKPGWWASTTKVTKTGVCCAIARP